MSEFTNRARQVLQFAREAAIELTHEYIGTEHLLLGLLKEGEGIAAAVLTNLQVDLEDLEAKIHGIVKSGKATHRATSTDLPYTSRAKKCIELAMAEAQELRHSYVGTEHLLLGILREEKGIAAHVLADAGVMLELARSETRRLMGGDVPPESTAPGRTIARLFGCDPGLVALADDGSLWLLNHTAGPWHRLPGLP